MDRAMTQVNRTNGISKNLIKTIEKLNDLKNSSHHSIDNSKTANDLNRKSKSDKQTILVNTTLIRILFCWLEMRFI